MLVTLVAGWFTFRHAGIAWLPIPVAIFVFLYLVFRDPRRSIPSSPLGVVSPVDGEVVAVDVAESGVVQGRAHRVVIRINALGTYTARSPVEGKVMDLGAAAGNGVADYRTNALWVRTDEGDDVVLQFTGYRFGVPPKSIARYGERLGQGERCAYLRLTRIAEVQLPMATRVLAEPGQILRAGSDLIGRLPHP